MKNTEMLLSDESIKRRIYTIRNVQVMIDSDLARLYEVKPTRLREQVKRNIKRFPENFMFQLSSSEVDFMVSQNAIPSRQHLGGTFPYAFTEQGVAMLSGVLRSPKAIAVSIQIMNAFVSMRKFISKNAEVFYRLENVERKQLIHDENFNKVFNALEIEVPKQGIFFDGQIFDAHKFVSDLIRSAKKSIILIDNYIDDSVLTLFMKRRKGVSVIIYTKNISRELKLDLDKFNSQYEPIEIKEFNKSHDRFMIIDDNLYHIGASLKDLGKKWFAFSKLDVKMMNIDCQLNKFK